MLTDKPEIAVEPPAEPPALLHATLCPDLPKPEHRYQHAAGHAVAQIFQWSLFMVDKHRNPPAVAPAAVTVL